MFSNLRENLSGEITSGVSPKSLERILQRHKKHKMSLLRNSVLINRGAWGAWC